MQATQPIEDIDKGSKMITAELDTEKLNMEKLSALYDRIYDIADRLFKKYNLCNIHTKNNKVFCSHHNEKVYNGKSKRLLCCSGCGEYPKRGISHWSKIGCVTKCLACKLYICNSIGRKNIHFARQLDRLHGFADKHNLPHSTYYLSKEQWLKQIEG